MQCYAPILAYDGWHACIHHDCSVSMQVTLGVVYDTSDPLGIQVPHGGANKQGKLVLGWGSFGQ